MTFKNLIDVLENQADSAGLAVSFLTDDEGAADCLTRGQLLERARTVAAALMQVSAPRARVLLLQPPGLDYVVAFFGCVLASRVPVPAYPPTNTHHGARIRTIVEDAQAELVLTDASSRARIHALLNNGGRARPTSIYTLDELDALGAGPYRRVEVVGTETAFLQYTSGSTSAPKGVRVTHANLLDNLSAMQRTFAIGTTTRTFHWLPPYHDMGLIGGILLPVYCSAQAYLMSPVGFIQKPLRWLAAISRYRITVSGAPNFGFEYCTERVPAAELASLDLSSWEVAPVGAEPVRPRTLEHFAEMFAPCGFDRRAFRASYGLAEATLLVAASEPRVRRFDPASIEKGTPELASNGRELVGIEVAPDDSSLVVVDTLDLSRCPDGVIGELWIRNPSVADGYWNKPQQTQETFDATIKDDHPATYLRTGDLGFLHQDTLYITGRRKELIILRGANYYPQDFEAAAATAHERVREGRTMAFSAEIDDDEHLVVVTEVAREAGDHAEAMALAIREVVVRDFGLEPYEVIVTEHGALPKTSSGKKERGTARKRYLDGELPRVSAVKCRQSAPTRGRGEGAAATPSAATMEGWLVARIAALTGIDQHTIDPGEPFSRYGLDSVKAVALSGELQDWLGRSLSPTLSYEFPSPRLLARFLTGGTREGGKRASESERALVPKEPIAIVGMACRFPGADGVEAYWRLLRDGVDAISEVPPDRWDANALHDPDGQRPRSMNTKWGGFIQGVDQFDREFFGISPREAEQMDPQQRLLLQTSWEALEDAGIPPTSLGQSETGVFVGISSHDYSLLHPAWEYADSPYLTTGNAASVAANRLSYFLDLIGPSVAVDTACSSSLVATHLACESLRRGESTLAIAAGVNLVLSPVVTVSFSRAGITSPDGRCKTFDARANGIARSEGVGVVILKPLSRAREDGDHIYALIQGGAVNQDGRSNGLTAPSLGSQVAVLEAAYRDAGVSPVDLDYIEAHGTGTPLGDPIECEALGRVLASRRTAGAPPCRVGSVKTNLGHLEAAAGIAGLMKLALALDRGELPPSVHFESPNPRIDFDALGLEVQTRLGPWERRGGRRVAGVSSFGFGGTNAHLVLSDPALEPPTATTGDDDRSRREQGVLPLSARAAAGVRELARRYEAHLHENPRVALADVCHTAGARRNHHSHRAAVAFDSRAELLQTLGSLARDTNVPAGRGTAERPQVAFVFSGQGSQWAGMGLELAERFPVFREHLEALAAAIEHHAGWSLFGELSTGTRAEQFTPIVQPAIFACQVALAGLLQSWGVAPAAVVGHSMGEVAAAHVAGVLALEDAVHIICERSRLLSAARGRGSMALVELSADEAERRLLPFGERISIAAMNGPEQTIVAGEVAALEALGVELSRQGVFYRELNVEVAGHCAQVEPIRELLVDDLHRLRPAEGRIPFFSTVEARRLEGTQLVPHYWGRNVREPVRFHPTLERMLASGIATYVEISPHPVLVSAVQRIAGQHPGGERSLVIGSMRRHESLRGVHECLAALYEHGLDLDWAEIEAHGRHLASLPAYPWQTERCWRRAPAWRSATERDPGAHPLLGGERSLAALSDRVWENVIATDEPSYLADHSVDGVPVFPGAGYVEMALGAARARTGDRQSLAIRDVAFEALMVLTEPLRIQTTLSADELVVHARPLQADAPSQWTRHACMGIAADAMLPDRAEPLDALRARCPHRIEVDSFYRSAAERGLGYGPAFRNIRELSVGEGVAVARIDTPDAPGAAHLVHPGVLDSALQVLGAAIPVGQLDGSKVLPVRIGRVECRGALPASAQLYCRAELRTGVDVSEFSGDLSLFTETGEVWLAMTDVVLRRIFAVRIQDEWFYEVAYQERPREQAPHGQGRAGARPEVLLLGAAPELRDGLVAALEAQGLRCHAPVASSSADVLQELEARGERLHAIIDHRACLADPAGDRLTDRAVEITTAASRLLALVQDRCPNGGPAVWLVTAGAQPVPGDGAIASLSGAPLWGLARSAFLELGRTSLRMVDLPASAQPADLAAFARDVAEPDAENQISYRGGRRYVARLAQAPRIKGEPARLDSDGSYVITGGLGALGLEVAEWAVRNGARYLGLVSRSAPTEAVKRRVDMMCEAGARVSLVRADVSSRSELDNALASIRQSLAPIVGVVHAAGVLEDGLLSQMTRVQVASVFAPKVAGALHLHELTLGDPVRQFVMFSSAASLVGSPAQTNYAAANAFMDALAHRRRAMGLHATSLNWGVWSEVGLAATEHRGRRLERLGVNGLATDQALSILSGALATDVSQRGVIPLRLDRWAQNFPDAVHMPFFEVLSERMRGLRGPDPEKFAAELLATPPGSQLDFVQNYLRYVVAKALRFSADELSTGTTLVSLGMDSITAVEIKNRVEVDTGVALPLVRIVQGASIHSIAELLHQRLLEGVVPQVDLLRDSAIEPAAPAASYRLSPPQRRYAADFGWDPARSWSTIVLQTPFPMRTDIDVLEAAWRVVCGRHDCLRTLFPVIDGERRQVIGEDPVVELSHEHLDHGEPEARLAQLRADAVRERWDTARGPLGKLTVVTRGDGNTAWIHLRYHRVMMDGASVKLLVNEIAEVAHELSIGARPDPRAGTVRYRDFSEWLNGLEERGAFLQARDYWREALAAPLPDPFEMNAKAAGNTVDRSAGLAIRTLDVGAVAKLEALAAENGWLYSTVLFAAYVVALWRAGGGTELVIDASLSGRQRPELRGALGFFTNAVAIRITIDPGESFRAVVEALTRKFLQAEEHQYFQYNRVIDDLGISREEKLFPLSGILFNMISFDISAEQLAGKRDAWQPVSGETRYGLMFYAMSHPECLSLELKHRGALVDRATAERILDIYVRLVEELLGRGGDALIGDIQLP